MSRTQRLTATWGAGVDLLGSDVNVAAASEQNISTAIPDNTIDFALGVDWLAGKLKSIFINVSSDCTLYVNAPSTGAPTDTIPLKAGVPFQWIKDSGMRTPFVGTAGAVTNMYVTTPNQTPDVAVQFDLRAALDL